MTKARGYTTTEKVKELKHTIKQLTIDGKRLHKMWANILLTNPENVRLPKTADHLNTAIIHIHQQVHKLGREVQNLRLEVSAKRNKYKTSKSDNLIDGFVQRFLLTVKPLNGFQRDIPNGVELHSGFDSVKFETIKDIDSPCMNPVQVISSGARIDKFNEMIARMQEKGHWKLAHYLFENIDEFEYDLDTNEIFIVYKVKDDESFVYVKVTYNY